MTPEEIESARRRMGLSVNELARLLRLGKNGSVHVRRWEAGTIPISGPASVAIEALVSGWRPRAMPDGNGARCNDPG